MKEEDRTSKEALEGMGDGELVEKMIWTIVRYNDRLNELDGQGSPYDSDGQLIKGILGECEEAIEPFVEELNRRGRIDTLLE